LPKRVDSNQAEIVEALRKIGCVVTPTHMVGSGYPDITVGFRGRTILLEIKSEKGKLTEAEEDWFLAWTGEAYVVRSVEEALEVVQRGAGSVSESHP